MLLCSLGNRWFSSYLFECEALITTTTSKRVCGFYILGEFISMCAEVDIVCLLNSGGDGLETPNDPVRFQGFTLQWCSAYWGLLIMGFISLKITGGTRERNPFPFISLAHILHIDQSLYWPARVVFLHISSSWDSLWDLIIIRVQGSWSPFYSMFPPSRQFTAIINSVHDTWRATFVLL